MFPKNGEIRNGLLEQGGGSIQNIIDSLGECTERGALRCALQDLSIRETPTATEYPSDASISHVFNQKDESCAFDEAVFDLAKAKEWVINASGKTVFSNFEHSGKNILWIARNGTASMRELLFFKWSGRH